MSGCYGLEIREVTIVTKGGVIRRGSGDGAPDDSISDPSEGAASAEFLLPM
jgi:hypothetical protein